MSKSFSTFVTDIRFFTRLGMYSFMLSELNFPCKTPVTNVTHIRYVSSIYYSVDSKITR